VQDTLTTTMQEHQRYQLAAQQQLQKSTAAASTTTTTTTTTTAAAATTTTTTTTTTTATATAADAPSTVVAAPAPPKIVNDESLETAIEFLSTCVAIVAGEPQLNTSTTIVVALALVEQLVEVHFVDQMLCAHRVTAAKRQRTASGASGGGGGATTTTNAMAEDDDGDNNDDDASGGVHYATLLDGDMLERLTALCAPASLVPVYARRNVHCFVASALLRALARGDTYRALLVQMMPAPDDDERIANCAVAAIAVRACAALLPSNAALATRVAGSCSCSRSCVAFYSTQFVWSVFRSDARETDGIERLGSGEHVDDCRRRICMNRAVRLVIYILTLCVLRLDAVRLVRFGQPSHVARRHEVCQWWESYLF
jgi:hypothetical protein